jgi:eukaryotic-like serine/threonine-protein kinase
VECLDANAVVAFFQSRLPEAEQESAEEHLASCAACRRVLAEYAAMAPAADVGEPSDVSEPNDEHEVAPQKDWRNVPDDHDRSEGRIDLGHRIAQAQAAKRIGTVLCGKWKIERLIGIGGMAQVFMATHRNGRSVAVKVMRPELAVEPLVVERFLREGYVANKVGHPGAVAILDDDITPEGAPFLVMEFLHGKTLSERLRDEGRLPLVDVVRVVDAVLDVLAAAHDQGIVHRDIKPDNLFETAEGEVKVLDFGIARLRTGIRSQGRTQSGLTLGTIGYMSPEQARGQGDAVDARSDLWSAAATLYALATGHSLHEAPTTNESLLLAMTKRVPPIQTLAPELPPAIAALLDTALAFDKEKRFVDARAMQEALRSASLTAQASVPPSPRWLAQSLGQSSQSGMATASTKSARRAWSAAVVAIGLGAAVVALVAEAARRPVALSQVASPTAPTLASSAEVEQGAQGAVSPPAHEEPSAVAAVTATLVDAAPAPVLAHRSPSGVHAAKPPPSSLPDAAATASAAPYRDPLGSRR